MKNMDELIEKLFVFTENYTENDFYKCDIEEKKDMFNKQFNMNLTTNEYRNLQANLSMARLYENKEYRFKKV
ncbi:MAG TPA: hypothetical protein DCL31_14870 [Clostridium sp.]|nr:hypothetical protein [Clostridium sp.]